MGTVYRLLVPHDMVIVTHALLLQWSKIPAAVAEHKVLSFIPYLQQAPTQRQTGNTATAPDAPADAPDSLQKADPSQQGDESFRSVNDPYGPRCWRSRMVELSGRDRALNEFSVERVGEEADQNLVMLHGYGAGLGFFYKNFEPLSRAKGWKLYALDMLGMGRSTRPPFKITAKTREEAITQAEDWFIDALEEWRVQRKIERFTLLAHSLGGYMAVAYALKYPGHLNKLILASPVGIPENPQAVSEALPESSSEPAVAQEFKESVAQNGHVQAPSRVQQQPRRRLVKVLEYLWDANVSPFSIVRLAGPLGPRLVSGWTSRRFAHLPAEEAAALHDYSYSIFRLRGSGEYALAYILAPRAYARSPLIRRIQGVGRQVIRSTDGSDSSSSSSTSSLSSSWSKPEVVERETGIPIVFMYGEHDWMDVSGGYAAKAKIDAERERRRAQGLEDNGTAKVVVIPKAGHHLYLDSPEIFNEFVLQEMEDVRRREQEKKR